MTEETIFAAALDLPDPAARAAYLDDACAGDADLRRRVESLLQAHAGAGDFLEIPPGLETSQARPDGSNAVPPAAPTADHSPARPIIEGPGSRIGPYKLLQRIGEGGMGIVYMAEQERPVRRKVALKIIKPGMDTGMVVARFEAERQALALMDHQCIARVLDAGATETGRPYFVMELVKGIPITRYCDEARLSPRERLELFVPVCQAIQHAHQKGIIHRDIKPSNILVTLYDGKPVPKVIDFGIAKATEQRLTERTLFTQFGALIGTYEYMSPEQAELNALDIDTRSDIYSLGVLLYELLTGSTPLERERLRSAACEEILRRIRDEDPPRPSTRLSDSGDRLPSIAAQRKTEPARLARLVRGELDWIVMKALEKDRTRRYETANGFARDVERYLNDEPVEACPPSAAYRVRKFARKHRGLLATASALAVLLMLGVVVSTWLMIRARQAEAKAFADRNRANVAEGKAKDERDRAVQAEQRAAKAAEAARTEAAIASEINRFLQSDLLAQASASKQANPTTTPDPNLTVRTALDRASWQISGRFYRQPLVEAALRLTIGNAYRDLGLYEAAKPHLIWAIDLRRRVLGAEHPDTLTAMNNLAGLYQAQGKRAEAEPLYVKAPEVRRRVEGAEHSDTRSAQIRLDGLLQGKGKVAKAEALYRRTLEEHGAEHPETLVARWDWCDALLKAGRLVAAETQLQATLDDTRRILGPEHRLALVTRRHLAWLHAWQKKSDQAEAESRDLLALERRVLCDKDPETLQTWVNFLQMSFEMKKPDLALEVFRAWTGPSDARAVNLLDKGGAGLIQQGRYAEAEPILRECLAIRQKDQPDVWSTFNTRSVLGGSLLGQKKYAEAEPLLIEGYVEMKAREAKIPAEDKARLPEAGERIIKLYDAWGQSDKSAEWRRKLAPPAAASPPGP